MLGTAKISSILPLSISVLLILYLSLVFVHELLPLPPVHSSCLPHSPHVRSAREGCDNILLQTAFRLFLALITSDVELQGVNSRLGV